MIHNTAHLLPQLDIDMQTLAQKLALKFSKGIDKSVSIFKIHLFTPRISSIESRSAIFERPAKRMAAVEHS